MIIMSHKLITYFKNAGMNDDKIIFYYIYILCYIITNIHFFMEKCVSMSSGQEIVIHKLEIGI